MRSYRDRHHTVVKMNISGASLNHDRRRIEAVLDVVGDGSHPAVDASGRFDLEGAIAYADALEPSGTRRRGDPLDQALQAELARHCDGPLATGENLFSYQDARNLLRYGGLRRDRDFLQFDCALSYGLVAYLRILRVLDENGWSAGRVVPPWRAPDVAQDRRHAPARG
jgi:D(-)-tartrate dehydratase